MTSFDVESLADHEDGFRRLAYQILGDKSQVDDILQDAYVAALESNKLPAAEKRLAWFRSVVRNIALMRLRKQSRRRRREKDCANTEVYEVEHLNTTWRRELAQHVMALREPYRRTVIDYYYEALSTAQIAKREATTPSTVRVRRARALEMLRARLNQDRSARWAPALLALLQSDASEENSATTSAIGLLAPSMRVAKARGTSKRAVAAIGFVVLLLVLCLWFFGDLNGSQDPQRSTETARVTAPNEDNARPTSPIESESPAPNMRLGDSPEPVTEDLKPASDTALLRVIDADTMLPIADAKVFLAGDDQTFMGHMNVSHGFLETAKPILDFYERSQQGTCHGSTNKEGILRAPRSQISRLGIEVHAEGYVSHVERHRGRKIESEYVVRLQQPWSAVVEVVNPEDHPVVGADVTFVCGGHPRQNGVTNSFGQVTFQWYSANPLIHVRHQDWAAFSGLAESPRTRVRLIAAESLACRIVDHRDNPVSEVELTVTTSTAPIPFDSKNTDSDGVAIFPAVPAAQPLRLMAKHPLHPMTEYFVAPSTETTELVLPQASFVDFDVSLEEGGELEKGEIRVVTLGTRPCFQRFPLVEPVTQIGPLRPGTHYVLVDHPEYAPLAMTIERLRAGEIRQHSAILQPGSALSGRVIDEVGQPAADAVLTLQQTVGAFISTRIIRTGEDGRFRSPFLVESLGRQLLLHSPHVLVSSSAAVSESSLSPSDLQPATRIATIEASTMTRGSRQHENSRMLARPAAMDTPTHTTIGTQSFVPSPIIPLPPDRAHLEVTVRSPSDDPCLDLDVVDQDGLPIRENIALSALSRDGTCVSLGIVPLDTSTGTYVVKDLEDTFVFPVTTKRALRFYHLGRDSFDSSIRLPLHERGKPLTMEFKENGIPLVNRCVVVSPSSDWAAGVLVGWTDSQGRLQSDLLDTGEYLIHIGNADSIERRAHFPRIVPLDRCSGGLETEFLPGKLDYSFDVGLQVVSRR